MIKNFAIQKEEPLVMLADEVVYLQKSHWCGSTAYRLSLSFMGPRRYFPWDGSPEPLPLIVFLCGGGFQSQSRNVWMPELAWFAKRGYAVAGVDYSTLPATRWPEQITEVRAAIRFLRARAKEFQIQPDNIALMGESAGGYLAALSGLLGDACQWDSGENLDQSAGVKAVVPWYPPVSLTKLGDPSRSRFPELTGLVTPKAPPFLILHGTADTMVPPSHGEELYQALRQAGVEADLALIEGAQHTDVHFVQPPIKEEMLSFLDRHLKRG